MPVNGLQQRWAQVGVIRLGRQLISKNNKPYPAKLDTFRFTSPSLPVIEALAAKFGGTPQPWASSKGPQFEVISKRKEIAVFIPQQFVDPNYERWGNGYCDRKCDGILEQKRQVPCLCTEEFGPKFTSTAPPGKACKVSTRLSLMIADLPSLGTFKLESHGWNAAAELPTIVNALRNAPEPIPGRLEIQARDDKTFDPSKAEGEQIASRNYGVPVLHIDFVTPAQVYTGQIAAAVQQLALGAGSERPALDSKPAAPVGGAPRMTSADWLKEIAGTDDPRAWDALTARMAAAGVKDPAVADAWRAQAAKIAAAAERKLADRLAAAQAATTKDVIVDAVIVDEPRAMSGAQAWQAALEAGHQKHGWNTRALAERFQAQFECDHRDDRVTDAMLVEFYGLVRDGRLS